MGTMSAINRTGDARISWEPDNPQEVDVARAAFDSFVKKGCAMFRVRGDDWRKSDKIAAFDPKAERIIAVPPIQGG